MESFELSTEIPIDLQTVFNVWLDSDEYYFVPMIRPIVTVYV